MNIAEISKSSILIVDDERDNLEVVAETLGFFGATVKTAKDGIDAFQVMETFKPTLILLDLSMPNMDGWTMHNRLKTKPEFSQIPVIALTAHAMQTDKDRVFHAGFDGYLTKPVNVPTIMKDIEAALAEGKAIKAAAVTQTQEAPAVQVNDQSGTPEAKAPSQESPVPAQAPAKSNGAEDTQPSAPVNERPTTESPAVQPESIVESQNTVKSEAKEPIVPAEKPASGDAVSPIKIQER